MKTRKLTAALLAFLMVNTGYGFGLPSEAVKGKNPIGGATIHDECKSRSHELKILRAPFGFAYYLELDGRIVKEGLPHKLFGKIDEVLEIIKDNDRLIILNHLTTEFETCDTKHFLLNENI